MKNLFRTCTAALAIVASGCALQARNTQSQPTTVAGHDSGLSDSALLASLSAVPTRFTQQGGEALYRAVCQGCHMPQGQGASTGAGAYPAISRNPNLGAGAYPAIVVMNGLKGMPPFGHQLDDKQIADVVNYVRSNFGNQYADALTASSVAELRPAIK